MSVQFESKWHGEWNDDDYIERVRLFVLAADERIKLIEAEGYDNGYYGTGYWIEVQ